MKKLFALYLAVIAVAMVGVSLHQFGFTLDDATAPMANFAFDFATFILGSGPIAILVLVLGSFVFGGIGLFEALFYPGKLPHAIGGASGFFSFYLLLYFRQGSFTDLLGQPTTVSVAAFWGFILLAVYGRWMFLPKQKPQKENAVDDDNNSPNPTDNPEYR